MKPTGTLVTGVLLSAAATLVATASAVAAAPMSPALAATSAEASITVSPGAAKVGSTVELRATCAGKITDQPTSPALSGIKKIANVPAPQAAWQAKVKQMKAGSYSVVYTCDDVIISAEFKVSGTTAKVAKTKQVVRKPVGAAKTGAGGTAGW